MSPVSFDVEQEKAEDFDDDVEKKQEEDRRSRFATKRDKKASVMTLVTTDNSKAFYDEDYMKGHLGGSREYWRDMILGVNDGLVSTFLLITGVYGSGMEARSILLTAVAGMIAGAISMAGGEYVATKTQEEVKRAEYALEEKSIKEHKQSELLYLNDLLTRIGIPEAESTEDESFGIRRSMMGYYEKHDEAHLKINVALAYGQVESSNRNPAVAGLVAFTLFTVGAVVSVIPFFFVNNATTGFIASFISTIVAILIVGGFKTWATKVSFFKSAMENFLITCGGGAIAYGIGIGFDKMVAE